MGKRNKATPRIRGPTMSPFFFHPRTFLFGHPTPRGHLHWGEERVGKSFVLSLLSSQIHGLSPEFFLPFQGLLGRWLQFPPGLFQSFHFHVLESSYPKVRVPFEPTRISRKQPGVCLALIQRQERLKNWFTMSNTLLVFTRQRLATSSVSLSRDNSLNPSSILASKCMSNKHLVNCPPVVCSGLCQV